MKLNKNNFREKFREIHGDTYNYDKSIYVTCKNKIIIGCKVEGHGYFEQTPNRHLSGNRCPKCFGKYKSNTNEFIIKAIKKHGNKYIYDKSVYITNESKIIIGCKVEGHGYFEQTPHHHLTGSGCAKCYGNNKINKDEFIKKANIIYDNKYNYDNIIFINTAFKINIHCPNGHFFEQKPYDHLMGRGCTKCIVIGGKSNTEDFIKKAKIIHNYLYNYDKSVYVNSESKLIIECHKHGEFLQTPHHHLSGRGCPKCKKSKAELKIDKFLCELKEKGIIYDYKSQHIFTDLKFIHLLKFDFVIFDKNGDILCLIEYNGEQHYKFVEFIHKYIENYESSLIRDKLKIDYCIDKPFPLFIIKYDENISLRMYEIINSIFNI